MLALFQTEIILLFLIFLKELIWRFTTRKYRRHLQLFLIHLAILQLTRFRQELKKTESLVLFLMNTESFRSQEMVRQQRRSLLMSLITPETTDFPLVLTLTLVELLDLLDRNPRLMQHFTTDLSQSHPHLVTSLLTKCNLNQQETL